ncbi:MurR/RpiR family transcriptional regulator [Serratia odorifera]|uniref:Transcriptional regulator, RpiR family n=2 Tax=Serratia odorifera TaxID=618 RepID=D4E7L0_SEROD|nr:MurR/RpiR family transcriptional regulator [Serratia odorifera]EFE94065.1 transcriptional regulator, RpiR family [Serratia odorifera DSM 4582]MBJ2063707.1 MurR/RpiR family transcriptional regulator [Serratia odorifera]PNK89068.1 MurR/RpiR family transcriptional regulator [Serratia odorifera]RII69904.1 MurR/RpiR family transcriptional regulator [Serratia odorifera]VDZ64271.1 DNA-binding transcriptional repressor RpiR [Serratia odorifera]
MNFKQIFSQAELSKTDLMVLEYIYQFPELCIDDGIRAVSARCYSSPSTVVRLAKKLGFRGYLELVYFIKFNLVVPPAGQSSLESGIASSVQQQTRFLELLDHGKILIHGSGFSQLVAQYMYNKFMTLGIDSYLSLWPDFDILDQKMRFRFDMVIVISKSGNSGSALSWGDAVKRNHIQLAAFCGDGDSPLAQRADMTFIFEDRQKYDHDIYYPNPFFGHCLLGFENLVKAWFERRSE